MTRSLIFGITGQTGSYLAELLLAKGHAVHGVVRRCSSVNTSRLDHLPEGSLALHYGDVTDALSVRKIIDEVVPSEVYNLAAQSHVGISFKVPSYTISSIVQGTIHILEAIRQSNHNIKFYNAASSEMFGISPPPQSETTPFRPCSPYACAKVFSFHQTVNYRESYGIHASNGILFNHESPRRGEDFVTRKITLAAARIAAGRQKTLSLGNLDAMRDWGYAPEYAEAIWRILDRDEPGDFVIATGETHTIQEFLNKVFWKFGLDVNRHVVKDYSLLRPAEVPILQGDASKARNELGWTPDFTFSDLVEVMCDADRLFVENET